MQSLFVPERVYLSMYKFDKHDSVPQNHDLPDTNNLAR